MGYIISQQSTGGFQENQSYLDWPQPKALKILCGFLGEIGYYKKFLKKYGKVVSPLKTLLKKCFV